MVKLLLISPAFPDSFWSFSWAFDCVFRKERAANPPLGLATVAALTPPGWEVTIVDENVEPIDFEARPDIVGVGGMSAQSERQQEILAAFRRRGIYTVAGGSFATLCPERYSAVADSVVAGEAERIWPQFCRDFEAGAPLPLYVERGDVDMTSSPCPRFELLQWDRYLTGSVQFSRGCPFQCEFCDIIVMFGRRPRVKTLEQVERELDSLRRLGVRNVVFVDDNLIGHLPESKRLLRRLGEYQEEHRRWFAFGTEATINLAQHPDVLEMFREAKFAWIFIGIESPDADALRETRKLQNTRVDLLDAVRTIYSYGIDVFGGFIVGFDADGPTVFERQYRFIVDSGIVVAMVGMLMAPPRTPLYERLQRENRLVIDGVGENTLINAGMSTNIIPLQMTREELIDGVSRLHQRLLEDDQIFARIRNKMTALAPPASYGFPAAEWLIILYGLIVYGVVPGGPRRWLYFTLTLLQAFRRPRAFTRYLRFLTANWVYALSLRRYAHRLVAVSAQGPAEAPPTLAHAVGE
jgi:radical SAM superfamily enzyme YgiQ (UPF0313 family)